MLKVTIKLAVYCIIFLFLGCNEPKKEVPELEILHNADSTSEARIDSAYAAIRSNCDSLLKYKAPVMADSLLKDSAYLKKIFDTALYADADEKVEKVIRQLQADCDSSLLKETYRIVRLRQKAKPVPRKKPKALPAARRS